MPAIRGGFNYDELPIISGRATGGSATTLTDTSLDMEPGIHAQGYIRIYPGPPGNGMMFERIITNQIANQFTFNTIDPGGLGITVERGTPYEVIG